MFSGENVLKSIKLQKYMDKQALDVDDYEFLEKVKLEELLTKANFDTVKNEVARYNELKEAIKEPSADIALISDEMKRLRNEVLVQVNRDIDMIDLGTLDTTDKLEDILSRASKSENDLVVTFVPVDRNISNDDYVRLELYSMERQYMPRLGINTGARMVITKDGTIITPRNAIYSK